MRRAPAPLLIAIVGASFLVRMVVGWLRPTPILFPDEYIYAALGRSIADSGHAHIRGGAAHFPALLEPLLTAPAWLIGDVGLAYRLIQTIGALAMSLAAVPVYLIARRLGLSRRIGLALAALAVLVPDLVYASFISSEALAYPLVLTAVYAAMRAVAQPSRRGQLGFVVAATLATLARVQFAVLPIVFALTVVVVGARERRVKAALREQALPLGLFGLAAAAAVAAGLSRTAGIYHWLLGFHAGPVEIARWAVLDAMTLAYASGWVIVPGALLGVALALARPRSREELSFAVTAAALGLCLLLEAGFLQASLPPQGREIQERYVFYAVPLLGLCFALYAKRGWPLRLYHLVLAGALFVVSVRVPLSGFAVSATLDASPILYAVFWLAARLQDTGAASLAVAVAAGVLLAVAVATSRKPRLATPVALALALLATATASSGAVAFNVMATQAARRSYLPSDPSYVDHTGYRHVALLQSFGDRRAGALQQLFWNRSVDRVLLLPGAEPIDAFKSEKVKVARDGSLLVDGQPVRSALVVDNFGSTVRLQDARRVVAGPVSTLWAPVGTPRLSLYMTARFYDGWLGRRGRIVVWPSSVQAGVRGRLRMTLRLPANMKALTIRFVPAHGRPVSVAVEPGGSARVDLPICAPGPWRATFSASSFTIFAGGIVSARATAPTFTPSRSACPPS